MSSVSTLLGIRKSVTCTVLEKRPQISGEIGRLQRSFVTYLSPPTATSQF